MAGELVRLRALQSFISLAVRACQLVVLVLRLTKRRLTGPIAQSNLESTQYVLLGSRKETIDIVLTTIVPKPEATVSPVSSGFFNVLTDNYEWPEICK